MVEVMEEVMALRKRVSELEMDQQHYRQILKNLGHGADRSIPSMSYMQEAVFVLFDRRLEFVNDQFAELFGVMPEEASGPDFDPAILIAPESRRLIGKIYHQGCRGAFATKHLHFTGLAKDGRKIACETFLLFIPYKWGLAVQGTMRSVSMGSKRFAEAVQRGRGDLRVVSNAVPVEAPFTPMRITG
jgi:PAS domain-containing protein